MLPVIFLLFSSFIFNTNCLSSNYDYYTSVGIESGLSVDQSYFLLNGKNISVYSGSIHYFRVPRAYWRDRIKKLKAMGANTLETYIAWNLHEPEPGHYDLGSGGSDMEDFLHLEEFIQMAQEEDLFMIVRPGPYICAEFESGGFPSWMLRDEGLAARSSNKIFMNYVTRWFNVLMPLLAKYQFTTGGPIIALQVENEFAGYSSGKDKEYLRELRQLMLDNESQNDFHHLPNTKKPYHNLLSQQTVEPECSGHSTPPTLCRESVVKAEHSMHIQRKNQSLSSTIEIINAETSNTADGITSGIVELLVTSDNPWRGTLGTITDLFFMTGNFNSDGEKNLGLLKEMQPGKPVMVMEYWSGWFDYLGKSHQTRTLDAFRDLYEIILSYPASANIYMFIGGTNYGFLSGAGHQSNVNGSSRFSPITTSYDYDALLAENGDYTDKYYAAKELLKQYANSDIIVPDMPELIPRLAYPSITVTQEIDFNSFLSTLPNEERTSPVSMEQLNLNNGGGQSYGYIVYSKTNLNLPANSVLKIVGYVYDTVVVLVNGKRVSPILENRAGLEDFGTWATENSTLTLTNEDLSNASLDLIVENWGRVNYGAYKQYKGIFEGVEINNQPVYNWKHSSLEFKKSWLNQLSWNPVSQTGDLSEPKLLKATLNVAETPKDTYVHMENWTKGLVVVNNVVLGKYSKMGPQQALYLPAPFLKQGDNDIVIFEHFRGDGQVNFVTDAIFKVY